MNIKIIRSVVLFGVLFLFGTSSAYAYGVAPSVSSFTVNPQSVSYGYTTLLTWTIDNGAGHDLYFTCPPTGVKIKRDDGTAFPCNTRQSISSNSSDSASFYIVNLTGSSIVVPVKIIPKDSSGTDYDGAAQTQNLYVGTVPNPITDFSFATSSVATSTYPITLSWTGVEIAGSNLQFDCKDGIQIYSTNPAVSPLIVCGQTAYTSDQLGSGSASVYFVNSTGSSVDETIRIFPAISTGMYDATHSKYITLTIPPKSIPLPSVVTSFSSPQTLLASGQNVSLSWAASNTSGVNLQIQCGNSITWNNIQTTSAVPLSCGVPGFTNALPAMGSTTLAFVNGLSFQQNIPVTLFPQNADGTYDGTKARTITLTILEPGHVNINPVPPVTPPAAGGSVKTEVSSAPSNIKVIHTLIFSTSIRAGSRGAQVTALQSLLKQDPTLYPEGLVTGYMGQASIAALKRFQERYGIAKKGDSGYGLMGPKTRAKLNSLDFF